MERAKGLKDIISRSGRGLCGGVLLLCASVGQAGNDGKDSMPPGDTQVDWSMAYDLLFTQLDRSVAHTESLRAAMYVDGNGVRQDQAHGIALLAHASLEGDLLAISQLGRLYFEGRINHSPDPIVGYALQLSATQLPANRAGNSPSVPALNTERAALSPEQLSQARSLAVSIQHLGVLLALRAYLGVENANKVLCNPKYNVDACVRWDSIWDGPMTLQFRIDGNGAIELSGRAIDFNELKVRLMMAAVRVPEPRVLLTVDGEGPVVNEAIAMMAAQAEAAGCSLYSVVRGRSTAVVPLLGDHLYSMVPAMVDTDSQSAHPPIFPRDAIKALHEGSTVLFVSLDDKGQPLSVKVRNSSGFAELDASAATAAKQWRYEPCVKNGVGRACGVRVPINFNFNRQPPAADDKSTTKARNGA